ncbi:GNAT family N-acetyltransferase [Promethearchaeum syntrophicum]|uniref:GNAT family N-acetyltransferase n=1 Tax=Promethearchaeum syntrophicum TaxID=2594042 RepID=A0A5B9DDQ5_9ARCH|nr:GNAT family protein [Candidatus Prometheoarchaeum syntrophicum]QEE17222.1 ribosomal-protein-S5-alanine N-acetyltransferase [Candidatus Prometheoarchaeum syntrophicum]
MNSFIDKSLFWKTFPELTTPRLELKQITSDHAQDLLAFWGEDTVTQYTDFESFKSINKIQDVINWIQSRFEEKNGIRWGIFLKTNGKMIGTCGFNSWITKRGNKSEIGYDLHPKYWRRGIMYEALTHMITYGFQTMKLHRIEAHVDPDNMGSQKILEKLQFTKEGCLRENGFWKGRYWTNIVFGLLEPEFFL